MADGAMKCPHCSQVFKPPPGAPKVRCPGCQAVVEIPQGAAPAAAPAPLAAPEQDPPGQETMPLVARADPPQQQPPQHTMSASAAPKAVPKAKAKFKGKKAVTKAVGEDRGDAMAKRGAFKILDSHGLLCRDFQLPDERREPEYVEENATAGANLMCTIFCCPLVMCKCVHPFVVDKGTLMKVSDGRGNFYFHGPGTHRIEDPFFRTHGAYEYDKGHCSWGDLTIVNVDQTEVGFAKDKGRPICLPPGMHQWKSQSMKYVKSYGLDSAVIKIGPLTLLTVNNGYAAITEDNGEQKIFDGGNTYLLTHKNWKFQKYAETKNQYTNMEKIEATSADNVLMSVSATVHWVISDVEVAALNAIETIAKDGGDFDPNDTQDIKKLTSDVMKQAEASLAAFIGAVNYSDTFNVAANVQEGGGQKKSGGTGLFDQERMQSVLEHANDVTQSYGVTIKSINVVSAVPSDPTLSNALAQGAVAAAEAQQYERVAAGESAAIKTEAAGLAEAAVLKAEGFAQAEIERAEGKKAAADLLMQNNTAVQFAITDKTAECLGAKANKAFFFGNKQGEKVGALLATAFVAEQGMPGKTPYEPAREPSPTRFGDEKNDKFQTRNADELAHMASRKAAGTGLNEPPKPPQAKAKAKAQPKAKAAAQRRMKCGGCGQVMAAPTGASQVACPGCGQHLTVPK